MSKTCYQSRLAVWSWLFSLVVVLLAAPASFCASSKMQQGSVDLLEPEKPEGPEEKYPLTVWMNVPHNNNAKRYCMAFPFITELPTPKHIYGAADLSYGRIREALYLTVYSLPMSEKKPYPVQGWRFMYALHAAERELHITHPHFMNTAYPYIDEIYPVLRRNLAKSNEAEAGRKKRYDEMKDEWTEHHTDMETEAMKAGREPVEMRVIPYHESVFTARARLTKGTWYITASHSVLGIQYYWQEKVEIDGEGPPKAVELNEKNALLIDGTAW